MKTPFLLLILLLLAGCTNNPANSDKIQIVTTIFPLYDFAKSVAGDRADVIYLLPPGADSHSWEPRPSDIRKMSKADVFIYVGESLEPWAEAIRDINPEARVIEFSAIADTIESIEPEEDAEDAHGHEGIDPHMWLSFENDLRMVDAIAGALGELSPEDKAYFQTNAEEYKKKLNTLSQQYESQLADCRLDTFIVAGHSAFGYLARDYGLNQVAVSGISPDAEPSAQRIASIIDEMRENNIKYLVIEPSISERTAASIADETDAEIVRLSPGHTGLTGDSFLEIMENNLESLKTALECN